MTIVIIGAGYVGLPLAIAFAKHFNVICYDINKERIVNLKRGLDDNKQYEKKEILKAFVNFGRILFRIFRIKGAKKSNFSQL